MILKALTLENFKGIREPVRIEFAPLTLLFGPNNAGKSTIVQALMYAREVLERNNCDVGRTVLGGDVIDLGGFRSLVHGQDLARSITMRFELDRVELHNYIETDDEENLYDPGWLEWELDSRQNPDFERIQKPTLSELTHGLTEFWVEIEISWVARAPVVKRYEVGTPGASFARIILNEKGQAGILATEKSYHFALDVDDLEADVVERYRMACEIWLDDPDDQDRVLGLELPLPVESYPAESPDAEPPAAVHWQGRIREYRLAEGAPVLHRLIRALPVQELYVSHKQQWFVNRPLPLVQKDSALPPWNRTLPLHPKLWDGFSNGDDIFASDDAKRDFLVGRLTSLITGPGRFLRDALEHSVYLSSFREMPSRRYQLPERLAPYSWASGTTAWDVLIKDNENLLNATNHWLVDEKRLDSGYEIVVAKHRELPGDSKLWNALFADDAPDAFETTWVRAQFEELPEGRRLEIRDQRRAISLVPQDLGVGISQVIPVIVASLQNTAGIVAIEEPESNIHPAWQVVLADLFITQAKANPDVLFLVETHSEHLMLRCLRRIRETAKGTNRAEDAPSVAPEDIAVHFVEPTADGPRIRRIEIDEDGDFIDEWPGGFFEESYREKFAGR